MLVLFLILRLRQSFNALPCISAAEFIHFVKHDSGKIHLLRAHHPPTIGAHFLTLWKRWFSHVLGSGLPVRETNPPRSGSNLWGRSPSPASSRRGKNCRPRHGGLPFRKRDSLASRSRRRWETSNPRTLLFSPTKTPRIRRRRYDGTQREHEAPRMANSPRQKSLEKALSKKAQVIAHPYRRNFFQNSAQVPFNPRHK